MYGRTARGATAAGRAASRRTQGWRRAASRPLRAANRRSRRAVVLGIAHAVHVGGRGGGGEAGVDGVSYLDDLREVTAELRHRRHRRRSRRRVRARAAARRQRLTLSTRHRRATCAAAVLAGGAHIVPRVGTAQRALATARVAPRPIPPVHPSTRRHDSKGARKQVRCPQKLVDVLLTTHAVAPAARLAVRAQRRVLSRQPSRVGTRRPRLRAQCGQVKTTSTQRAPEADRDDCRRRRALK